MQFGGGLTALVWCSVFAHIHCDSCRCVTLPSAGVRANCSSQGFRSIPQLPADVTELLLQHNLLTTVTPGYFDALLNLQLVNLSENPFNCECNIRYLSHWLKRNQALSGIAVCASPAELAHRPIDGLADADFPSCVSAECSGWVYNSVLCFALCFLIGLLLWCLQLARNSTFTLGIDERHSGLEAEALRSLKPKHRARMRRSIGSDDMDNPLLNMELLPQILDVLHKQHNIKIKVP
ncbi:platelet glycoprotein IX-like isoform X1 [Triplophysa rosa]|uniref:Platelet glycoprotein IX n=1 Tax=Triplophysa rosa TaxID=992332 RepID=A0A9W7TIT8_TRIRA|nr:platelet glycoprotein IX-like isoform X1 [Triplophysa rosa]XP_057211920.1 platelet glycoprotein IX-like isoform X1 [Triplophysa rosa]XP_057211921.1 platelet glycoprotein IX-like isoform X1 [Triplophysa rosa]XP_057211922.1 platelet glycoprotein IX-like isoform X1 [Triplophysa rosa]XP_057211923.1 platelet glycoprotein IX-like isoform X1 [Triplophysa rosa]XP_057211924.1 platelet glycoprotein IX-like isoform X1 [Triplophysa rosa]KAI7797501.1 putative platelet glycoprotein IX [Triplophysa rosa]